MMIQYDEIFSEVRQRVAAFQYWKEFTNQTDIYGMSEEFYLDEAYRFLFTSASKDFMDFCAKKENMTLDAYCDMLGIKFSDVI